MVLSHLRKNGQLLSLCKSSMLSPAPEVYRCVRRMPASNHILSELNPHFKSIFLTPILILSSNLHVRVANVVFIHMSAVLMVCVSPSAEFHFRTHFVTKLVHSCRSFAWRWMNLLDILAFGVTLTLSLCFNSLCWFTQIRRDHICYIG
jgi:hypothetical protein